MQLSQAIGVLSYTYLTIVFTGGYGLSVGVKIANLYGADNWPMQNLGLQTASWSRKVHVHFFYGHVVSDRS